MIVPTFQWKIYGENLCKLYGIPESLAGKPSRINVKIQERDDAVRDTTVKC